MAKNLFQALLQIYHRAHFPITPNTDLQSKRLRSAASRIFQSDNHETARISKASQDVCARVYPFCDRHSTVYERARYPTTHPSRAQSIIRQQCVLARASWPGDGSLDHASRLPHYRLLAVGWLHCSARASHTDRRAQGLRPVHGSRDDIHLQPSDVRMVLFGCEPAKARPQIQRATHSRPSQAQAELINKHRDCERARRSGCQTQGKDIHHCTN